MLSNKDEILQRESSANAVITMCNDWVAGQEKQLYLQGLRPAKGQTVILKLLDPKLEIEVFVCTIVSISVCLSLRC